MADADKKSSRVVSLLAKLGIEVTPHNRTFLLLLGSFLVLVVIVCVVLFATSGSDDEVARVSSVASAEPKSREGNDSAPSEYYKEAQAAVNDEKYRAAEKGSGFAMPYTFDLPEGVSSEEITGSLQGMTDAELLVAMERLGLPVDGAYRDFKSLGESDLCLKAGGQLITCDGGPVLFDGVIAFVGAQNELVDNRNQPILDARGLPMYVGTSGAIYDPEASEVVLLGRLTTESGIIFLPNGQLVTRTGNMSQWGSSDIWRTLENQLVTVDGLAIKVQGRSVVADDENRLLSVAGDFINWEGQPVYITSQGAITDPDGKAFSSEGLLISTRGTIIDNRGYLKERAIDFDRLGESDLYLRSDNFIAGSNGKPVNHYGVMVKRATNGRVMLSSGHQLVSRNGAPVTLTMQGVLRTAMGKGVFQSGGLVDDSGVAFARNGRLLSRAQMIDKRGSSDLYEAGDGLLTDSQGRPTLHDGKHVFIVEGATSEDGSDRIFTFDGLPVLDFDADPIELMANGVFRKVGGDVARQSGILTTYGGILLSADGRLAADPRLIKEVLGADGRKVYYSGEQVFRDDSGVLVDDRLTPFYAPAGGEITLLENGNLVDQAGMPLSDFELLAQTGSPVSGPYDINDAVRTVRMGSSAITITRDGALADLEGKGFTYRGWPVSVDENTGRLYIPGQKSVNVRDFEGGDIFLSDTGILTRDDKATALSLEVVKFHDGAYLGLDGQPVSNSTLRLGESDIYTSGTDRLFDAEGRAIRGPEGELKRDDRSGRVVYVEGLPLRDIDGETLFISRNGLFTRKGGDRPKYLRITNQEGVLYDKKGRLLNRGGLLTRVTSSGVFRSEERQLVSSSGVPVLIDDDAAFVNEENAVVDALGQMLRVAGRGVFLQRDGILLDSSADQVLAPSGRALSLRGEGIYDDAGFALGADETPKNVMVADIPRSAVQTTRPDAAVSTPTEEVEQPARPAVNLRNLDAEQTERLYRRAEKIQGNAIATLDQLRQARAAGFSSGGVGYQYEEAAPGSGRHGGSVGGGASRESAREMLLNAGDALYVTTSTGLNTDLGTQVVADLVALPGAKRFTPKHPLYGARLTGQLALKYDQMVIEYNSLYLKDGTAIGIDGVALNTNNLEAAVGGDVDRHLLYRYGGLFVGSIIQGAAIAAGETRDTVEISTGASDRFQTEGLDGTELAIRSLEPLGQNVAQAFSQNINRPITVSLPVGSEMGVILFEPVFQENMQ
ncbi:hypothetical protein A3709_19710 [Halioglobus sp. HI00S01]|uniref:DotG/IcmE/VirB10 family protein n=1 Tax=Halioglobus sp. HI00S01 TaxID=1822214 RepID=UPI0007C33EA1|nr:DotG/IcmE/VirB10 family protein [Halioglobus sp. HI00S01]KZX57853.1 hypothetical protein A3709_19710 [Halioglobus sp. HI00S01]